VSIDSTNPDGPLLKFELEVPNSIAQRHGATPHIDGSMLLCSNTYYLSFSDVAGVTLPPGRTLQASFLSLADFLDYTGIQFALFRRLDNIIIGANNLRLGSVRGLQRLQNSGQTASIRSPIFLIDEKDPTPDPNVARFLVNFPLSVISSGGEFTTDVEKSIPLYFEYDIANDRIRMSSRSETRAQVYIDPSNPKAGMKWEVTGTRVSLGDGVSDPTGQGFDFTPDSIVTAFQNFGKFAIKSESLEQVRKSVRVGFKPSFAIDSANNFVMTLTNVMGGKGIFSEVTTIINLKDLALASDANAVIDALQLNAKTYNMQSVPFYNKRGYLQGYEWQWHATGSNRLTSWSELEAAFNLQKLLVEGSTQLSTLGNYALFSGIYFTNDGFYVSLGSLGNSKYEVDIPHFIENNPLLHVKGTGTITVYEGSTDPSCPEMTFDSWFAFRDYFYVKYQHIKGAPPIDSVTLSGNSVVMTKGTNTIQMHYDALQGGWMVDRADGASVTDVGQTWPSYRAYAEYYTRRSGANQLRLPDANDLTNHPFLSEPSATDFWLHGTSGGRSGWVHVLYDSATGLYRFANTYDDSGISHGTSVVYSPFTWLIKDALIDSTAGKPIGYIRD